MLCQEMDIYKTRTDSHDDLPRRVHAYADLNRDALAPSPRLPDRWSAGDHEAMETEATT